MCMIFLLLLFSSCDLRSLTLNTISKILIKLTIDVLSDFLEMLFYLQKKLFIKNYYIIYLYIFTIGL